MMSHNDLAGFSETDLEWAVELEKSRASTSADSQPHPTGVLLAGQPGSGKTGLASFVRSHMDGGAIFLNGDEYRKHHPHYRELFDLFGSDSVNMTSAFSGAVTEALISRLSDGHFNLIVEGTGRRSSVLRRTAEELQEKGYTVEVAVMAARPELSLLSTLLRFYAMNDNGSVPRATAIDAHDHVLEVLPHNLDELIEDPRFNAITIRDRDLRLLYDSRESDALPSHVLREFWNRPWTVQEKQDALIKIEYLREREAELKLFQSVSIDEAERRILNAPLELEQGRELDQDELEDDIEL